MRTRGSDNIKPILQTDTLENIIVVPWIISIGKGDFINILKYIFHTCIYILYFTNAAHFTNKVGIFHDGFHSHIASIYDLPMHEI